MKNLSKLEGADRAQVEALVPLLKEGADKARAMVAKIIGANPAAAGNGATGPITTDIDCDECGKPMMIRKGRRGPFLGCSGYPKCKNTGEVPAKLMEEMEQGGNGSAKGNGNGQAHPPDEKGAAKSKSRKPKSDDEIETDLTIE